MMISMMGEDNPMFTMEHEEDPKTQVGKEVTVSAKLVKKSEYEKEDGKTCFICEYEVLTVDGQKPDEESESEVGDEEDDYKELEKTVDEEMSKSKNDKEGEE